MSERPIVTIITGATKGIGRVLTEALLDAGHDVLAVSRRPEGIEALQARARPRRRCVFIAADVAEEAGRVAMEAAVRETFGYVTVLVNNAGVGMSSVRADYHERPVRIDEIDATVLQRFFNVNAGGPIALALRLLPLMNGPWGRVVNIGTSLNAMMRPGFLPYGMSKAALESGTAVLAKELEGGPVTVNLINPGGPIDTPMTTGGRPTLRRDLIPPQVLVDPVRWLASPASHGVNGKRITATRWRGSCTDDAVAPIGWPQLAGDSTWRPAG
jgi:NAD(P)-dependent dehydrogenase (short-subunit alcohol dehydrogenase family)